MRKDKGDRRGFALAIALIAIVVIGALIAGVFFASTQEYRIGRNTLIQTRALTSAEFGLNYVLRPGELANSGALTQPVGGAPLIRTYSPDGASIDTLRITRLNTNSFLVVSEGTAGSAGSGAVARRRIGGLIVINPLVVNALGALTTRGTTQIGGSSFIDGNDNNPPGWGCPPPGPPMPGIATPSLSDITTSGCNDLDCVSGDPKVLSTPAAAEDSTYFKFGDLDWAQITAMASKIFPGNPTLTGIGPTLNGDGSCKTMDNTNWGDPLKLTTCGNYYPVIYAPGDLKILTGRGQGILLVEGDLEVQGGFQFFGPVIVKGRLRTAGTGGHFNGGVLAANVDLDQNTVLGNAVISYSSCVLRQATSSLSIPGMAAGNSWVEMF
jgi:hypothetical protein